MSPMEIGRDTFERLLAAGSDYDRAMHEARLAMTLALIDAGAIACADTFPAEWSS